MRHARTKRARVPHARIRRIDVDKARALDGVHAVLTHADVPGRNAHGIVTVDWPVLCHDKLRYVGDAVAIVAADSEAIADAALALIEVDYDELPAVTSPLAALAPDAPLVHEERPDGNLLKLFFTHPLLTVKVIGGIHWQALKIWLKGGKYHRVPEPPLQPTTVVGSGSPQ
jgi:CO/xanthine dehydrogenase Mo-binding subunit